MRHKGMKLLSVNYLAQLLDMTPRTIARWCREGKFSTAHKVGRVWRVTSSDPELHVMLYRKHSDD